MLLDLAENRLLWLDSHLFALLSYDLMTGQQVVVDEFDSEDEGLAGVAVFEVMQCIIELTLHVLIG